MPNHTFIPGYRPKNLSGVITIFRGKRFHADEKIAYQKSLTRPGKWMVYGWITRKSVFFCDSETEAITIGSLIDAAQAHSLATARRPRTAMEAPHA